MTDPSPEDVYVGTLISLLGAIESGTTTVADWYDGPATDEHIGAALRAHADSGIRTVLILACGADPSDVWRRSADRYGPSPDTTTMLAAGSPSISGADSHLIGELWTCARELGVRIHFRGGPQERGAIADLDRLDILGEDVTVAHCTGLSDEDLDVLASSHVGVNHLHANTNLPVKLRC